MQKAMQHIFSELEGFYSENEIRSFSFLIIEKLTGLTRTQIIINKNTFLSAEQNAKVIDFVDKLKKFEPIQYLLGETEFYGLAFMVNNSVLIPRPETEELVDWIITDYKNSPNINFLDIGTGSGCIAISIKKGLPTATATAFDISEMALDTASKNAALNNVEINFARVDILNPDNIPQKWDVIVSNPPYIPELEKKEIQSNVLDYEPHLALFVPDHDALLFYRTIAEFGKNNLTENGRIYFEIHRNEGETCVQLLEYMGYKNIELRKDISGNNRMIKAILK